MADAMSDPEKKVGFTLAMINPDAALPSAVEWIADNMEPTEVFPDEKLAAWAAIRGWTPPPKEEE